MSDKKLWEQYVALEKERDTLRSDLAEFQYAAAVANDTIKALQAKVEQMERQEPECEVVGQVRNVLYEVRTLKYDLPAGTKLYALPGAQPAPSEEARLVSYCPDGNTCTLNINGIEMYYDRVDRDAAPAPDAPDATWLPVPDKHPTFDPVDLQLADGSVLCGCVPQIDGDYWWEGPSGEVFIDPRYAPVTHWRLSAAPEARQ